MITLIPVLDIPGTSIPLTYRLLLERPTEANISHKSMPAMENHRRFVQSHPYAAWYVVVANADLVAESTLHQSETAVGSIYLTKHDEIGYFILKEYQRRGYAEAAVKTLIAKHGPKRYLLNIAPGNEPSLAMARKLGGKLIQHTFEITP